LELNIFYGVTTVASSCLAVAGIVLHWQLTFAIISSCLAVAGIVLHWQLTFVEQFLFLQAPLVWATYRLSTVVHEILPTKDRNLDDIENTPGSNMVSSRAMDVIGKSTDEKQENDIPR
jgi:hypothetical protein